MQKHLYVFLLSILLFTACSSKPNAPEESPEVFVPPPEPEAIVAEEPVEPVLEIADTAVTEEVTPPLPVEPVVTIPPVKTKPVMHQRPRKVRKQAPLSTEKLVQQLFTDLAFGRTKLELADTTEQNSRVRARLILETRNTHSQFQQIIRRARDKGFNQSVNLQLKADIKAAKNDFLSTSTDKQLLNDSDTMHWEGRLIANIPGQDSVTATVTLTALVDNEEYRSIQISSTSKDVQINPPEVVTTETEEKPLPAWIWGIPALLLIILLAGLLMRKKKQG